MRYLICLPMVLLAGCSSGDKISFPQLVNEFVTQSLSFSPVLASASGYHNHQNENLDRRLDDWSEESVAKQRAFYSDFSKRLDKRAGAGALSAEERADISLMRGVIEQSLVEFDLVQRYRHDPTLYTDLVGNALFNPLMLEYAPIETRYGHIVERMKQLPALLGQAQRNLLDSPEAQLEAAIRANESNRELIVVTLKQKAPTGSVRALDAVTNDALRSLDAFGKFLHDDLSQRKSDFRLGPEKYAKQFHAVLGIETRPDELYEDARQELTRIRAAMVDLAGPLHDKLFRGQRRAAPIPMVRKVLDKIAATHATPDSYFAEAKADLDEATMFASSHGFMPMPMNRNLQVIPTPEFMRGIYAVGGFNAAPPLEPKLGAFYWITPIPANWDKSRVESKLREYDRWGLKILTIHEAMPGHYLQFEFANTVQPAERRILRALYSSGPYVEGWAVYATELMVDQGYLIDETEMRLSWYKHLLRAVSNTILDIGLHTKNMSDDEAMNLMIEQTFQEKEEAEAKLIRAKLTSAQLPTYFAGWREWRRIREAEQKRLGSQFNLKAFHEKALRAGGVRLADLPALLAQ